MFTRFSLALSAAAAAVALSAGVASADTLMRTLPAGRAAAQTMVLVPAMPLPRPAATVPILRPLPYHGLFCPEGWVPAAPPLNWQLGCLPNTIVGN